MAARKAAVIPRPVRILLLLPWTPFVREPNIMQRRSVWVWDAVEFQAAAFKGYIRNSKGWKGWPSRSESHSMPGVRSEKVHQQWDRQCTDLPKMHEMLGPSEEAEGLNLTCPISSIFVVSEVAVEFKRLWVQVHLVLTK